MTRLAALQHACSPDMDANLETGTGLIAQAAKDGARLAVLPEVHLSPFFPKHKGGDASAYAMTPDHPALAALSKTARDHGIVVVANLYLQAQDGKRYDASPVFDADGTLLGVTCMNKIAQFDGFWEKDYYAEGSGLPVYETAAGRLGVVICYDRHFPESYRRCAAQGAEIIATPTCVEAGEPLDLFEAEIRTMAFQNHVYAVFANRCGEEDGRRYAGASLVAGPDGRVLARGTAEPGVVAGEYDLAARAEIAARTGFLDGLAPGRD